MLNQAQVYRPAESTWWLLPLLMLAVASPASGATLLSGEVVNPANGNSYYLLTQDTWTASEAFAVTLGGHLVTIDHAAEKIFAALEKERGRFG